jgi:hypothetical protein
MAKQTAEAEADRKKREAEEERKRREQEEERADMRSWKRVCVWRGGTILGVRCRFYKKIKYIYIPFQSHKCAA